MITTFGNGNGDGGNEYGDGYGGNEYGDGYEGYGNEGDGNGYGGNGYGYGKSTPENYDPTHLPTIVITTRITKMILGKNHGNSTCI